VAPSRLASPGSLCAPGTSANSDPGTRSSPRPGSGSRF
jgi:hypothetical protein